MSADIERRYRERIAEINENYRRDVQFVKYFVGTLYALMLFGLVMAAFH